MIQEHVTIETIPAILWGEQSDHLFIAVHGNVSHKEDTVIHLLADEAMHKGYQVLSFDLPDHGERRGDGTPCKVQICVSDLKMIMQYATSRWKDIRLFACSMGAYFSLLAYPDTQLRQALFLSPVVDMERIIRNMMTWFQVTPERLKEEGTIDTPAGQKLYWDYFCYVKDHPIERWNVETAILFGAKDEICEYDTISHFVDRFHCVIEAMQDGEHYFHTDEQLSIYTKWLHRHIPPVNDRALIEDKPCLQN